MAPKYKLMYFNGRGRAEISRLLFAQAGVEYEDCRLTQDEFKAIKGDITKCPLGQLPVLVVDYNKIPIAQSRAIERHLARSFGMLGKNEMDTTRIDIVSECVADLFTQTIKVYFEKDEAKKAEMKKDFIEKGSVPVLTALSMGINKNSEGKGFCIGDEMTLADIELFNITEMLYKEFPVIAEKYPVLKAFNSRMRAEPKIAAWLAKRPDTTF